MSEITKLDLVRMGGFDHLVKTQPNAVVGKYIDEPHIVYEDGRPTLGYFFVSPGMLRDIRAVVRGTKPQKSSRTNGLPTQSTIYGVMPRNKLRTDYCRFTSASRSESQYFKVMDNYCELLCGYYEKYFPESYASALNDVRNNVNSDWIHNGTPYQTININVNHAIKYHRDTGNFRGAMSTVLIVKDGVAGGGLAVPEYDMTLSQRDGAFTLFDGQSLIHGVLPITKTATNGYRASIVFYSMNALKNCYPYQKEIDRLAARERDKSTVRYSIENKKKLIRMNKKALQKINSPYLKWIEDDDTNEHDFDNEKTGKTDGEV